jgi:hypothetical protein
VAVNDNAEIPHDAWPTFAMPDGVARDGATADPPPPSSVTPPAVPATPPAAADGQPPAQLAAAVPPPAAPSGGGTGQPPADGESIPRYRLDEQRQNFERIVQTQQAQIDRLGQMLERAMGRPAETPPPAAPPEPPSPQDVAIRERLLKVIPELAMLDKLKPIIDRSDDLLGAANVVPHWMKAEETFYDRYAASAVDAVYEKVAKLIHGDDKTAEALDEFTRDGLLSTFTRWVTRDPQRAARFENQDPKVVDEFVSAYKASLYDPVRRDRNAALQQRVENPPAIPQGGGATPPAPATPQPLDLADEDAVHARAWANRDSVGAR